MARPIKKDLATRLSISLPESVANALDRMVSDRGFESRSHVIQEMVQEQLTRHAEFVGTGTLAGTINLTYDRLSGDCGSNIAAVQHRYLHECIASLHVQLEQNLTLEVILVQGKGSVLRKIANELMAIKGVLSGNLNFSTHILPPLET